MNLFSVIQAQLSPAAPPNSVLVDESDLSVRQCDPALLWCTNVHRTAPSQRIDKGVSSRNVLRRMQLLIARTLAHRNLKSAFCHLIPSRAAGTSGLDWHHKADLFGWFVEQTHMTGSWFEPMAIVCGYYGNLIPSPPKCPVSESLVSPGEIDR